MATTYRTTSTDRRLPWALLRATVVLLTLATATIHANLGGPLFTMNAIGYTALAIAMVVPGPIARARWLVRLALAGFALATIGGWVLFGARFPLAYLDKAIEVVLVGALTVELWALDGGPTDIARRLARVAVTGLRMVSGGRP